MQLFEKNINSFSELLKKVNADEVSRNAYAVSYLKDLLQHKKHYLEIYARVLSLAFSNENNSEKTLLDFGTGNGLLALFAKYCGVQKVYASDVNEDFLMSAQQLGKQLNIEVDGWILGNENKLLNYFSTKQIDIVVGTDVIEHIYNLSYFFSVLKKINKHIITVFTTASVAENYFKSYKLKKLQIKDELKDSNAFQSSYSNEYAGLSFLAIRRKIIEQHTTALSKSEIEDLAIATRGLRKDDIVTVIDEFELSKKLPNKIKHKTNTCDPITGSFTERLLTVKEYEEIYAENSFKLFVYNGFYNDSESGAKALLAFVLNKTIVMLGKKGIYISPFILLKGEIQL